MVLVSFRWILLEAISFALSALSYEPVRSGVLSGRVLDGEKGVGVAEARISVGSPGHGSETRSAEGGRFRMRYRSRGAESNEVRVRADGFAAYRRSGIPRHSFDVKLERLPERYWSIRNGMIPLNVGKGQVVGWRDFLDFESDGPGDSTVADVIVRFDMNNAIATVRSRGAGGVAFVPLRAIDDGVDVAGRGCLAPRQGYERLLSLDVSSPDGLVFVRTRDGSHYARFEILTFQLKDAKNYDLGSQMHWRYWYNPEGGRGLCTTRDR